MAFPNNRPTRHHPEIEHPAFPGMLVTMQRIKIPPVIHPHPVAIAVTIGILSLGTLRTGADWPRWRGPLNDGHAIDTLPLGTLPESLTPSWTVRLGAGFSSPVVAAGKLAVMDNENDREMLRIHLAADGRLLWKAELDDTFTDTQGPPGPRNTPVIDGDRVYAVSCMGELQCRRLTDGQQLWRINYTNDLGAVFIGERGNAPGASRHGNNGSPLVDGPHLIAPVGGTNGHAVVAFDKLTGRIAWHSQDDTAGYGAPVVAEICGIRQVVVFTVDAVLGLRRTDGQLLWRVPLQTAYGRHVMTPIVSHDHVVVGSHQVGLVAVRLERHGDDIRATTAWINKEATPNFAQPVAYQGSLFTLGPKRHVLCLDILTGRIHWRQSGLIVTPADRAYCSFVIIGDEVLMLSDAGELILFHANPHQFDLRGRVQLSALNWCNPAYVDGTLYLRDGLRGPGNLLAVPLRIP